ncbi:GNAT family N-acetyltransferase [Tumidithrix elongata RA019]|uniref:GNAT family N-acetyltransferase n=1 Tax=Tumidithrix elongata BACA0141 TaxID=2716417 RepID=A0AAW9PZJ7_9CYAN|nr:GNAT family N-acetyltransferase [Tumidithrix elongata RA019]
MQSFPSLGNTIRPLQRRDLEIVQQLESLPDDSHDRAGLSYKSDWLSLVRLSSWLPNPLRHLAKPYVRAYVSEYNGEILGFICVSPTNGSRSTWQIDRVAIAPHSQIEAQIQPSHIGTQLIRYCLESCWEARTWLLKVDIQHKDAIALYRQNGFQPLAQLTNWEISAEVLQDLAQHQPDLPNLLPVSNADAGLLYQLDTAAMPPQIRQVYDLSINDFRTGSFEKLVGYTAKILQQVQEVSGYVYEPQRKAAIGYFSLALSRPQGKRQQPEQKVSHYCQLTVHPAYTWLYPELTSQVAQIVTKQSSEQSETNYSLLVSSADYQPEREAYLEQIQAQRQSHGLLMARSVWHKIRETKLVLDGLQLSRMLSGLQPNQKPVPGRIDAHPPNYPSQPEELP